MPEVALDDTLPRDSVYHCVHSGLVKSAIETSDFLDSASTSWSIDCIEASTSNPVSPCLDTNILSVIQ